MRRMLSLMVVLLLTGCGEPQMEYATVVWWDAAKQPGKRVRVLRHTESGSKGQDLISVDGLLNLVAEDGWKLVGESRVQFGTEYRLARRKRSSSVYYTTDVYEPKR